MNWDVGYIGSDVGDLEMLELEAQALELELKLLSYDKDGKEDRHDYPLRKGDVTSDELKKIFGFRYVNIDINLDEKQEQDMLNVTYDTFRLLAMVINQPMISIGLGRNLTIGIGIKRFDFNVGGAYYRNTRSLQFKNLDEFKHIAHEWFHAFDNYLWYTYGDNEKDLMMSEEDRWKNNDYNHKTKTDFNNLKEAINQSEYMVKSESVAKVEGKYWSSKPEVFARAFEIYANERMNELGEHNNRLVFLYPNNPYPNLKYESDRKIMSAFRTLFDNMEMADIYDIKSLYGNN